jgi:integrase
MWNVRVDPRHPRSVLTADEFVLLDDVAETSLTSVEGMCGPERAFLYRMAVSTGLRRSELASLTAASFVFNDPPPIIVEAVHSKHREQDTVFIRFDMVEPLKAQVRHLQPGEPLFPLLAQRKTAKMIKFDLTAVGIPYQDEHGKYADFHSLRHRFITKAWETGEAAPTVMNLARHKDLKTTMRYTHADTSAQVRAIQAMKPPSGNPD